MRPFKVCHYDKIVQEVIVSKNFSEGKIECEATVRADMFNY